MTKETSPAFQFYPKDWRTSLTTSGMSHKQKGIYIDLLCVSWMEDGLPENLEAVSRAINADIEDVLTVVELTFKLSGTKWKNRKQESLRKEKKEWIEKCRQAGKKSAAAKKARKQADKSSKVSTNGSSTVVQLNANTSSLSSSSSSVKDLHTQGENILLQEFLKDYRKQYEEIKGKTAPGLNEREMNQIALQLNERGFDIQRLVLITNRALTGKLRYCPVNPVEYTQGKWIQRLDALEESGGFEEEI